MLEENYPKEKYKCKKKNCNYEFEPAYFPAQCPKCHGYNCVPKRLLEIPLRNRDTDFGYFEYIKKLKKKNSNGNN